MGQEVSTVKSVIKLEKRDIKKQERVIGREISTMERQKDNITIQLKKQIKMGEMENAQNLVEQYALLRHNISKLYKMKYQIAALAVNIQNMGSQNEISDAMVRITNTMKILNEKMNLSSVKEIIEAFEKEKNTQEIIQESLDTMNEDEDIDQQSAEDLFNQVLAEIGIELNTDLQNVPRAKPISYNSTNDISNIQKRFERLI